MCCVIPPNSFSATFDLRTASRSEVLPWSTWPMTVTTGGRSLSCAGSRSSSSTTSPSTDRTSRSTLNLSATSFAAVGSSSSLTVAMTPSSSSALITSPDFRRIFSASSPTVTDSGTRMSSRFTSAGGAGGARRRGERRGPRHRGHARRRERRRRLTGRARRRGRRPFDRTERDDLRLGLPGGRARRRGRDRRRLRRGRRRLGCERHHAGLRSDLGLALGDERGLGHGLRRGLRLDDRRRGLDFRGRLLERDVGGLLRPRRRLLRDRRAVSRRGLRRGLRPHGALRLRLLGQLAATPKLDPQRVREHRVERAHGTQPLVTHLLGGDHELLARHAELFRELHQLYLCRHGPLTSSEPFSPLASDGGASITGPPRLLGAPRTATPRNLEVCTTPISSLASDGGAPAPRDPEVRTAIASSALASQGFLNAWVSRARASARPRHRSSAHT